MRNPVNRIRLEKGIDTLQVALQGRFSGDFVTLLAESVKSFTDQEWDACVKSLASGTRKPLDLTLGDFLEALRDARYEQSLKDNTWKIRPGGSWVPDWKKLEEKVSADPKATEGEKAIVRMLAERKKPSPMPLKGGEKYRRS